MRTELAALQQRLGITTIFVTHDQVEAVTMGGPVAVSIRPAAAHVFDATSHTALPTTQDHAAAGKSRRSFDR